MINDQIEVHNNENEEGKSENLNQFVSQFNYSGSSTLTQTCKQIGNFKNNDFLLHFFS